MVRDKRRRIGGLMKGGSHASSRREDFDLLLRSAANAALTLGTASSMAGAVAGESDGPGAVGGEGDGPGAVGGEGGTSSGRRRR